MQERRNAVSIAEAREPIAALLDMAGALGAGSRPSGADPAFQ